MCVRESVRARATSCLYCCTPVCLSLCSMCVFLYACLCVCSVFRGVVMCLYVCVSVCLPVPVCACQYPFWSCPVFWCYVCVEPCVCTRHISYILCSVDAARLFRFLSLCLFRVSVLVALLVLLPLMLILPVLVLRHSLMLLRISPPPCNRCCTTGLPRPVTAAVQADVYHGRSGARV